MKRKQFFAMMTGILTLPVMLKKKVWDSKMVVPEALAPPVIDSGSNRGIIEITSSGKVSFYNICFRNINLEDTAGGVLITKKAEIDV